MSLHKFKADDILTGLVKNSIDNILKNLEDNFGL